MNFNGPTLVNLGEYNDSWKFCMWIASNGRMEDVYAFRIAQSMLIVDVDGGGVRMFPDPSAFVATSLKDSWMIILTISSHS